MKPNGSGDFQPAEVALVFPPASSMSFDAYYSSMAVLAGTLRAQGFRTLQVDLNRVFADTLFEPSRLDAIARGEMAHGPPREQLSTAAFAARLLSRLGPLDIGGGILSIPGSDPSNLTFLVQPVAALFEIDCCVTDLVAALTGGAWWTKFYADFFDATGFAATLPPSIHTVGISVAMPTQLGPALVLSRHIRRARPDVRIILGGATVSFLGSEESALVLNAVPALDALVRFEGEIPLTTLVQQQRAGSWCPMGVPGVTARGPSGIVETPPGPGLVLDKAPYPDFDPALLSGLSQHATLSIIQARGCYWGRCAYCSFVESYRGSRRYRTRTARNFVDEMECQSRTYGGRPFSIVTESLPPAFARQMCEAILERKLDVRWNSFAMADRLFTPELLRLMARAGCCDLVAGIESMTERVLRLVDKRCTADENAQFIRNAKAAGVNVVVNVIPNLPSTTYDEACQSLTVFEGLAGEIEHMEVFPFAPSLTSKVGREPGRFGLVVQEQTTAAPDPYSPTGGYNLAPLVDPAMTAEERQQVCEAFAGLAGRIRVARRLESRGLTVDGEATRFRFAREFITRSDDQDQIELANWLTGEFLELDESWREILTYLQETPSFDVAEFTARFDESGERWSALRERFLVLPAQCPVGPDVNELRQRPKILAGAASG